MLNSSLRWLPPRRNWFPILLGSLILAGLYVTSRYNFLLFHCLAEAYSIVIAIAVFAIFWNTRQFLDNSAYLVIGFGCLFAGILDLDYIFFYPGMSVFPRADGNIALQAKTAAKWFVSLSCVGAFPFLRRQINQNLALLVYSACLALTLASIFYWHVFPNCYVKGAGITAFERIVVAINSMAYLGALLLLVRNRREFDSYVFKLLAATLVVFFMEDAASAAATELNGQARIIAHLCQVVGLYFVYKAFVEVGVTKPYDLLFRRQQQSAEALERQQQFLEAAAAEWAVTFDAMGDGISVHGPDYTILKANQSLCRMLGRTKEELVGRKCYQLYHGTNAPIAECPIEKSRQTFCKEDAELFEPTLNKWLAISASPVLDDGRIVRVVHTVRDITDRRRAEEALRQSEEGLRLVLEASGVGWWSLDFASGVLTADERCKALMGLPPAAVPSFAMFLERIFPADRPVAERHIAEAAARSCDREAEYRVAWPDGSVRWLFLKGRSFHDTHGKPLFKGVMLDVTERKRAQDEQLQRNRRELAHVARLSMMGEMAASLAHELNQPLHAVNNYASGSLMRLLKTPHADQELVSALEQIVEEANRAAGIVRRVRAFVEKREPQLSAVLVNNLIEEVVLFSKAEMEQRHAKVVVALAKNLPLVLGDPVQIEQVIMNLVRNGLEAMDETPEENRLLSIKTFRHGDDMVQVDVADRGKGSGEADREKMFQPFFTTKPEGMGMGLAISRSIVQVHGGRLWVSTDQDQGCTFHFTLPVGKRS